MGIEFHVNFLHAFDISEKTSPNQTRADYDALVKFYEVITKQHG